MTYTVAGNAKGAFCQFPFRYKGVAYYECTRIDNRKLWCSTTPDYDADKLWGVCAGMNIRQFLFQSLLDTILQYLIIYSILAFQTLFVLLQVPHVRRSPQVAMQMELLVNSHSFTKMSCTTNAQEKTTKADNGVQQLIILM